MLQCFVTKVVATVTWLGWPSPPRTTTMRSATLCYHYDTSVLSMSCNKFTADTVHVEVNLQWIQFLIAPKILNVNINGLLKSTHFSTSLAQPSL